MKPLEGIRILDLTQFLAGPYCTMILADLGAEVIKLERPPEGDPTRFTPPGKDGGSTYFISCNRNKKSVVMDMKDPRQRKIFFKMIEKADVLVENYKPGTMERMGCGYDALKKINPRLVYTAISGFGQTGPLRERAALDLVIQGMSGLMSVTGERGGEPQKTGISIADMVTGMYGAMGTIAALRLRDQTGQGQMVDVAMLDSTVSIMENTISSYCLTGEIPRPIGNRHSAGAPFQPFNTIDGKVLVCAPIDDQWARLCDGLDCPDLKADARFLTISLRHDNEIELEAVLVDIIKNWTTDDLCSMLQRQNLVFGTVDTVDKMIENPQVKARDMIVDVEYPGAGIFRTSGSPIKIRGIAPETSYKTAVMGEDTEKVLSEFVNAEEFHAIYDPIMYEVEKSIEKKALK